jgi:hypothetical protein
MSRFPLALGASLALVALPPKAWAQSTWTVDDDGPADFSSISVAAAAVSAGDVLLIYPGNYGFVQVSKELTLLGVRDESQAPNLTQLSIQDCAAATVANLVVGSVYLARIPGRSRLSEMRVQAGFFASEVGELFVARSILDSSAAAMPFKGPSGVEVRSGVNQPKSRAQFVDCVMAGGLGLPFDLSPGTGGDGLLIQRADVLLIQCSIQGGTGLDGPFSAGSDGSGLVLQEGSVEVRGGPNAVIAGGPTGATGGAVTGLAVAVPPGNPVVLAGGATDGAIAGPVQIVPPRPYLAWIRTSTTAQLGLFSHPGDLAFWVLSLGADFDVAFAPLYGLALTLDLQLLLASGSTSTLGGSQPAGPVFGLPTNPAFYGLAVPAQALVLDSASGLLSLTNGDDLLLAP